MNRVSILGCGWLGLPLTKELSKSHLKLKISTRETKLELKINNIEEYDIDMLSNEIHEFLSSEMLIINIPSKNIDSFANLITKIETSSIKKANMFKRQRKSQPYSS